MKTMSAVSKTAQLQTLLQSQLQHLKSESLGSIVVPHAIVIQGESSTALPAFTTGNLCQTIANLRNCPNARIYIQVPPNREGHVPPDFKDQLLLTSQSLKLSAINGGDVIVQSGLGPQPKPPSEYQRVMCLRCQCGLYYRGKNFQGGKCSG